MSRTRSDVGGFIQASSSERERDQSVNLSALARVLSLAAMILHRFHLKSGIACLPHGIPSHRGSAVFCSSSSAVLVLEPSTSKTTRASRKRGSQDRGVGSRLSSQRLSDIPGVGPKNQSLLEAKGLRTAIDLLSMHRTLHGADAGKTQLYLQVCSACHVARTDRA